MNLKDWATRVLLISLMFVALSAVLLASRVSQLQNDISKRVISSHKYPTAQVRSPTNFSNAKNPPKYRFKTTQAFASYIPKYEIAWADRSNYGERFPKDINGIIVNNLPIVVLHETSNSVSSAINFFQTPHTDENVQASYHAMIKSDGTVIYTVPPDKRAFGAANSVFDGVNGSETVKTNPNLPPSVNNFAYHVSLETPPDGWTDKEPTHSGYTEAQYFSLAWLIAQSDVADDRITTHRLVDRSGQRIDPRSFDFTTFLNLLHDFRQPSE